PYGEDKRFVPPIDILLTNAAAIGSAEMSPSRDLIVRALAPNEQLESMSWAAATLAGAPRLKGVNPERFVSDLYGKPLVWTHYYGPPNYLPHLSYSDVLAGRHDAALKDKFVFIGARLITKAAGERKDEYRNPYSFWISAQNKVPFIAGVEIQATMFLNLLRGDWLRRLPYAVEIFLVVLLGAGAGYGFMRLRPRAAIVAAL